MSILIENETDQSVRLQINYSDGSKIHVQMDGNLGSRATLVGVPVNAVSLSWGSGRETTFSETLDFERPLDKGDVTRVRLVNQSIMRTCDSSKTKVWSAPDESAEDDVVVALRRRFSRIFSGLKAHRNDLVKQELQGLQNMKAPSANALKRSRLGKLIANIRSRPAKGVDDSIRVLARDVVTNWKSQLRGRKRSPNAESGRKLFRKAIAGSIKATGDAIRFELPDGRCVEPVVVRSKPTGGGFAL